MNLKSIIEDKELLEKKRKKGKLSLSVPGVGEKEIDPLEHLRGKDGVTPEKEVDYFTPEEQENFKKAIKPIKGVDYFDGEDGYTPVKGVDYFDGEKGDKGDPGESIKGEKGDKGDPGKSIKGEKGDPGKDGVTTVVTKEKDLPGSEIARRIEKLEGADRLDVEKLKNLDKVVQWARAGVSGGGILEETDPIYTADKPDILFRSEIVDTKANILASTPTAGNAGFSSDTLEMFVADGSDWRKSPLGFGTPSDNIDIGAIHFDDNKGYELTYIDNKTLSNIAIGGHTRDIVREGSLRQNFTDKKLDVYLDGEWERLITMTPLNESEIFYYSQERKYSEEEVNGHKVMQFGRLNIGAIPSDYILDGGEL